MNPGPQPPQWQPPPGVPQYPPWSPPPYPNRPRPPFLSRLGKPARLLLGIVSLWPVVSLVAFMAFFFVQFFSVFSRQLASPQPADPLATFHLFRTFFILQMVTMASLVTTGVHIPVIVLTVFRARLRSRFAGLVG